jgi:hypothetical protein
MICAARIKKGTANNVNELGAFIILPIAVIIDNSGVRIKYNTDDDRRHKYRGILMTIITIKHKKNRVIGSISIIP